MVEDEIRARKILVVDADGKPRVEVGVFEFEHAIVSLRDENGEVRAFLGVGKDGPGLDLLDENGNFRARLAVVKDGPVLSLFDENFKTRAELEVTKAGPMLRLFDENGKTVWTAR